MQHYICARHMQFLNALQNLSLNLKKKNSEKNMTSIKKLKVLQMSTFRAGYSFPY